MYAESDPDHLTDEEEGVFDLNVQSSDEDDYEEDMGAAAMPSSEEESDDDEEDRADIGTAWGRKKSMFYDADTKVRS